MGVYAETVWSFFPGVGDEPELPRDTGWVVLTGGDPSAREVRGLLPTPDRLLVVTGPAGNAEDSAGVRFVQFEAGPPPRLGAEAEQAVSRGFGAAVLLDGLEGTSGRLLSEMRRAGVKQVAWRDVSGWRVVPIAKAVMHKPRARFARWFARSNFGTWYRRRLERGRAHKDLRRRNQCAFPFAESWEAHLKRVGVSIRERQARLTVLLYIGQLNSGGAERQCVNLAIGLARKGHRVRVLTTYPLDAENAHYCENLRRAGIRFGVAGGRSVPGVADKLRALEIHPDTAGALPEVIRNAVLDLAGELLAEPPDVLHCWLDYPNVIGAAAAALVGHGHVALSTRNVNPTYFPAFYQSWMDPWYRRLVTRPNMHLLGNSTQGAADYAKWLEIPEERFHVIYNGVDLAAMTDVRDEQVAALRDELGLVDGQPLVVGVFRLAQEKQPHVWVEVMADVMRRVPDARAVLVGLGDLTDETKADLAKRGLARRVTLLGQRKDISVILAAADVKLLTSKVEGTPNVILEAQWVGCPPVATAAGGTPDAMVDGKTGFVHALDDVKGMAVSVVRLIQDADLRDQMADAGRRFVRERFALGHMVDTHVAWYESLLGPLPPGAPPLAEDDEWEPSGSDAQQADAALDQGTHPPRSGTNGTTDDGAASREQVDAKVASDRGERAGADAIAPSFDATDPDAAEPQAVGR